MLDASMPAPRQPSSPAASDPGLDGRIAALETALAAAGFRGEIERDTALRAAMATDNSVYRIRPDLIVAPKDAADVVTLMGVMERPDFADLPLTARGGGTGTNGQSLNRGVILDMRRHMHRIHAVNLDEMWVEVEPGLVLDDLNAQLRAKGVFFAPETSTSTRCAVGGMVSTDASGKGSRIYGKTSDNLLGVEIARGQGLVTSWQAAPDWAAPMLQAAEAAARAGRHAFVENTPRLNRRFTGYDLERACPEGNGSEGGGFEWWRLFPGSEGTLGPITRLRLKLWPIAREKRLIVAGFASFRDSLAAALPLMKHDPTAIEVMDERVQALAQGAGLLTRLPQGLRPAEGDKLAYTFIEFNGDDPEDLAARIASCRATLDTLPGIRAVHVAGDGAEIRELWAVRSAGVGLLGKVQGAARPVAFVEDTVVPPENLPAFVDDFLEVLTDQGLSFGIYGHVDVGCLHIRPALDIDAEADRARLVAVSDAVYALCVKHGGIFWGEHGKGVRGAYLEDWIGPEAYGALQGVKAAFDPTERFNPGKLVSGKGAVMGIATTPFRPFNSEEADLEAAFRCNGNAQCLSYAAATPMCPSFKATNDVRHSPKGRADALRTWVRTPDQIDEADLLGALDTCLGCKACASTCPIQVDIPTMRAAFYRRYYAKHARPLADRLSLLAEANSPLTVRLAGLLRPVWPLAVKLSERVLGLSDLPDRLARPQPAAHRITVADLGRKTLPEGAVLVWMDWFSALFDEAAQDDVRRGLVALGYHPLFVEMRPAGKMAADMGDAAGAERMAQALMAALQAGAATGRPMVGLDPAFVMALRQDYAKAGRKVPQVALIQEFLAAEIAAGRRLPQVANAAPMTVMAHCTESTGQPKARADWEAVCSALGIPVATPQTGCCGMAGMYGHKARHQDSSRKLFDMSWAEPVAGATEVAATGFSCRCQTERLGNKPARHPLGLIADRLG